MTAFDAQALDDVIHGRVRLGIMAYLTGALEADFPSLKDKLDVTDGNLATHLRKLEAAGYVSVIKDHHGRKPRTRVRLTDEGRDAFVAYLDQMRALVDQTRPRDGT